MPYKQINLFLLPVLVIVLFFCIPFYNNWLYAKVLNNNFILEVSNRSEEARNIRRFGYSYTVFEDVAKALEDCRDVTLLLPPDEYVTMNNVTDLVIPEPAVFYYFTGLRAVTANSPNAGMANWALLPVGPGNVTLKKISLFHNTDSLLAAYRQHIK